MKNVARNILLFLMSVLIIAGSGGVFFTHHICRSHQISYLLAYQSGGECHHEGVCCLPEQHCCQIPDQDERMIRHPECCTDNHFMVQLKDFTGSGKEKQPVSKVIILLGQPAVPSMVRSELYGCRAYHDFSDPPPLLSAADPSFLGVFLI